MIYLDSSAIVKLIRPEDVSAELDHWLVAHSGMRLLSSVLAEVEVVRALLRLPARDEARLAGVMARIDKVAVSRPVRLAAAQVQPSVLRSLDAIHVASALRLGPDLQAFVAYDKRLLDAARIAGLPVASPGVN